LRAGSDRGRIYRVYPQGAQLRKIPRLDKLDTTGLVAAMDSPNGWQRDIAERLLIQAGDKTAATPLKTLATTSARPKVRLQALWTLSALGALTPQTTLAALKDSHPAIRESAVQLCEPLLQAKQRADIATGGSDIGGALL